MRKNDIKNAPSNDDGPFCDYTARAPKNSALPAVLIVILVIIILIGGFYLVRYIKTMDSTQNKTNNTITTEVKIPETEKTNSALKVIEETKTVIKPEKVVEDFYKWYTNAKESPLKDGTYKTHKAIASDLVKKIELDAKKTSGYDPFLCTKNKITGFNVGLPNTSGTSSNVIVYLTSASGITLPKINLQLTNDAWTMINIACLPIDGALGTIENLKNDTGLTYVTTTDASFAWDSANYKGSKATTVKGNEFETTNATIKTNAILNFLVKKGFKTDNYNTNGYKKGNVVCIYSDKLNSGKKHDIEVKCGEIK